MSQEQTEYTYFLNVHSVLVHKVEMQWQSKRSEFLKG